MKITPIEIRQKNFEKKLRGYDKDEVSAFLISLSNEWERVLDDSKELRIKLDQAQKEVQKLREVESSLFKTLKTAEDTGANLIDQANRAADLHMRETQMNADAMMNEAKSKAKNLIERAEIEARMLIEEMQEAIKDLDQNYRSLENHRENVIGELRNLSEDIMDRVTRTNKSKGNFKLEDHAKRVKALVRESEERMSRENTEVKGTKAAPLTRPDTRPKPAKEPVAAPAATTKKEGGSFFDQLGE